MSLLVAHFCEDLTPAEVFFARAVVGGVLFFPIIFRINLVDVFNKLLFLRGFFGTLAILIFFLMIKNVGSAGALAIHSVSPIFLIPLSVLFLKERINFGILVGIGLIVLGLFIPIWTNSSAFLMSDIFLGVTGALFSGISFFFLKLSSEKVNEIVIYLFFCMFQIITLLTLSALSHKNSPFLISFETFFNLKITIICVLIGLCACIGQLLMTFSYKKLPAITAGLLALLNIPFAVILEWIFFQKSPELHSGLLCLLIVLGLVIIRVFSQKFYLKA